MLGFSITMYYCLGRSLIIMNQSMTTTCSLQLSCRHVLIATLLSLACTVQFWTDFTNVALAVAWLFCPLNDHITARTQSFIVDKRQSLSFFILLWCIHPSSSLLFAWQLVIQFVVNWKVCWKEKGYWNSDGNGFLVFLSEVLFEIWVDESKKKRL